jgi:hypothetical protein
MQPANAVTAPKTERKTITIDLTENVPLYDHIVEQAEDDERTPATWVRRFLWEALGGTINAAANK